MHGGGDVGVTNASVPVPVYTRVGATVTLVSVSPLKHARKDRGLLAETPVRELPALASNRPARQASWHQASFAAVLPFAAYLPSTCSRWAGKLVNMPSTPSETKASISSGREPYPCSDISCLSISVLWAAVTVGNRPFSLSKVPHSYAEIRNVETVLRRESP